MLYAGAYGCHEKEVSVIGGVRQCYFNVVACARGACPSVAASDSTVPGM